MAELTESNTSPDVNIYVESETPEDGPLYEAVSRPFKIDRLSPTVISQIQKDTDLPRVGVSKVAISHDSLYLASVNEQCPTLVWIWDLVKCQLNSVIKQQDVVNGVCWAPNSLNLNISSNENKIYLWSLRGASVCQVPPLNQKEAFKVCEIIWNPNGKNFAALDKNQGLVFVYP
jgi:WD40 repeat protein